VSSKKPLKASESLHDIEVSMGVCNRCRLATTRNNMVFGAGDPEAHWMFIGEGPGAAEDSSGQPFVGRSGKLLTQLITEFGWSRSSVYIANVVKCLPPRCRYPYLDEIQTCRPFLLRQIRSIRPQVITTLGKAATNALLGSSEPMGSLRGRQFDFEGICPVFPTYHPSYILRGNMKSLDLMRKDFASATAVLLGLGDWPEG
jgi:uracil-DNA glycosylase family 4